MSKGKLDSKSRQNSQIRVKIAWQYTSYPNPAFRQLMTLLLKPEQPQSEYPGNVGGSTRSKHVDSKEMEGEKNVQRTDSASN